MSKKIVIVGGVAGGASTAARMRRLDEKAEIVTIERDEERFKLAKKNIKEFGFDKKVNFIGNYLNT